MKTSTMAVWTAGLLMLAQAVWSAPLDSVVRIFTVQSNPNYITPWSDQPVEISGSGCILKGNDLDQRPQWSATRP